jgi:hypothetical protein
MDLVNEIKDLMAKCEITFTEKKDVVNNLIDNGDIDNVIISMKFDFKYMYQAMFEYLQYKDLYDLLSVEDISNDRKCEILEEAISFYIKDLTKCQLFKNTTNLNVNVCSMYEAESKQTILNRLECLKKKLVFYGKYN